jgi:diketogulonate reductase-like aldo/keto reductase
LIHSPRPHYKNNLREVWKGLEEAKKLGLVKSIGVSNSGIPELEQILEVATVVPAVNQVRIPFPQKLVIS